MYQVCGNAEHKQILIFKSSEICSKNTDIFTLMETGVVGGVSAVPIHTYLLSQVVFLLD